MSSRTNTDLHIDWASAKAAMYACKNYHYSKRTPRPPWNIIGVWEKGKFKGVVIFSRGASTNLLKPYGLDQTEGCELTRIALRDHATPVTKIVKIAIKMLKKKNAGLRLIVSFADPNQGHVGAIYQAGNWVYTGMTAPTEVFIDPKGRELHPRQVSNRGYVRMFDMMRKCPTRPECKRIKLPGKHRYLYPLDDAMRKLVEPMRKPHPKKEESGGSAVSGASAFPVEGGGANPTPPLQEQENESPR